MQSNDVKSLSLDVLAAFSSYGSSTVTLAAPGRNILFAAPPEDGGFLPGLVPDSMSFFEGFEDGTARVTVVQEGAAAGDAAVVSPDRALTGDRALELRLDKSVMGSDEEDRLNGVLDLTIHDIQPGRELGQYLGLSFYASGYAILTEMSWLLGEETGADLADRVKAAVRQTGGLKDKVISGGVLDFDAAGNIPPAREPEPAWPLYDAELPLDMSTGTDPFDVDAQGDWESSGPMAALGDKLYYFPYHDDTYTNPSNATE